jgi:hypothetical protein
MEITEFQTTKDMPTGVISGIRIAHIDADDHQADAHADRYNHVSSVLLGDAPPYEHWLEGDRRVEDARRN